MQFLMDDLDEQISDDMQMDETNQEIDFECIFRVGSFFIDLSEFHNFGKVENYVARGWIPFDASIQAPGTVITESMEVKA